MATFIYVRVFEAFDWPASEPMTPFSNVMHDITTLTKAPVPRLLCNLGRLRWQTKSNSSSLNSFNSPFYRSDTAIRLQLLSKHYL